MTTKIKKNTAVVKSTPKKLPSKVKISADADIVAIAETVDTIGRENLKPKPIVPEVKTEKAVEIPKTFIEKMTGLTLKTVPKTEHSEERKLYVGKDNLALEIIDKKIFNRGTLKLDWMVRTSGGDKGIIIAIDEAKATFKGSQEHMISIHSEIEILDPEQKIERESKVASATIENGDISEKVKVIPTKPTGTKDFTKYVLDGVTYGKGRLIQAVILKYINKHNPTFAKLSEAFPEKEITTYSLFKKYDDVISESKQTSFFMKPEDKMQIKDGTIVVTNQVNRDIIKSFLGHVESKHSAEFNITIA